ENLQAVMACAEAVRIGKCNTKLAAYFAMVFHHAVQLASDVLSRHLHARQQAHNRFLQRRVVHRKHSRSKNGQKRQCNALLCQILRSIAYAIHFLTFQSTYRASWSKSSPM